MLSLKGVSKSYDGSRNAVEDINLEVEKGKSWVLLAPMALERQPQ